MAVKERMASNCKSHLLHTEYSLILQTVQVFLKIGETKSCFLQAASYIIEVGFGSVTKFSVCMSEVEKFLYI